MKLLLHINIPDKEQQTACRRMTIEERAREAMQNVESDPEFQSGDTSRDWDFLVKLFMKLAQCPHINPKLLTEVEDFVRKYRILEGPEAPTIDSSFLYKGQR